MIQVYNVGDYVIIKPFHAVGNKNNFPSDYKRYCEQCGTIQKVEKISDPKEPYAYVLRMDCDVESGFEIESPSFYGSEIAGTVFNSDDIVDKSSDASSLFGGV